jgi:hypothetical protein
MFTQSLEIIIWFVPSVIGDAVAVSLVGVPMFPIAMNHAGGGPCPAALVAHWFN